MYGFTCICVYMHSKNAFISNTHNYSNRHLILPPFLPSLPPLVYKAGKRHFILLNIALNYQTLLYKESQRLTRKLLIVAKWDYCCHTLCLLVLFLYRLNKSTIYQIVTTICWQGVVIQCCLSNKIVKTQKHLLSLSLKASLLSLSLSLFSVALVCIDTIRSQQGHSH